MRSEHFLDVVLFAGIEIGDQRIAGAGRIGSGSWKVAEQGLGSQLCTLGQNTGALDAMFQLADVAGPGVGQQSALGGGSEGKRCATLLRGLMFGEPLSQPKNVFAPLAQRGNAQADDVDPVVQVLAETTRFTELEKILMRGTDQLHVNADRRFAAQARHGTLLDRAQQLCLCGERHVTNLVEEQESAIRLFEIAAPFLCGAGERALLEAEHLRFEHCFRNGRAIDRNEWLRPFALYQLVQPPCHMFLADAGLSGNQHRAVRRRQALQHALYPPHRRTNAEGRRSRFGRRRKFAQLADSSNQVVDLQRLGNVVGRSQLEQAHGLIDGAEPRHEEEGRGICLGLPQLNEHVFPAHVRQAHVAHHNTVVLATQIGEGLASTLVPGVAESFHFEAFA